MYVFAKESQFLTIKRFDHANQTTCLDFLYKIIDRNYFLCYLLFALVQKGMLWVDILELQREI